MKLIIDPNRVMQKAGLFKEDLEEINTTIEEMLPYIESKIKPECLENENKWAILSLAATDIIVGRLMRDKANNEMDSDGDLGVGPIKLGAARSSSSENRLKRADRFITDGWDMIGPCLIDDTADDPFAFMVT